MLDPMRLGWSYAIILGAILFWMGMIATTSKYGAALVITISSLFPGYANTLFGSLLGLLWGLVDGFVLGWVQAKLYNTHAHHEMHHLAKHHPMHVARIHEHGWLPASGRKKKR